MARFATLKKGDWEQFERNLAAAGLTAEDVLKLNDNTGVIGEMLGFMHEHPDFRLIHGRFTPLADKIAMVKSWPGVNPADVDAAFEAAKADGTIAGYEAEVGKNPLLDIVIVAYLATIWETLLYARERMRETWGEEYNEREDLYAQGVNEDRIKAIPGAKPFVPNRIVFEVVDFGANWDLRDGTVLQEVQETQAEQLADFAVIYEASESPRWVERMDGERVPYAIAAALLLNVPNGYNRWSTSPSIRCGGGWPKLCGCRVDDRLHRDAIPVRREFKLHGCLVLGRSRQLAT